MRPRTRWLIAAAVVLAAAAAVIAWRTARYELPMRVWHKYWTTEPPVVSDRPGVETLASKWQETAYFKAWNVEALWREIPSHRSWLRSLSDRVLSTLLAV